MDSEIKIVANRYEILSLIGQGGMADVYQARDTILNRVVAIKILRDSMSEDPMTLVRFQREASAASRLSHPNVVDIYDVGEYKGMHYIVMEYIRGRTLKQMIKRRGSIDLHESLNIMIQLTSAIKDAHSHNIIHRDIKPQNVLVKDDGTVKITDFGIAIANDNVQLTMNNAVMGSAHYLAPETAQGKEATPQVDIYSLGIVFYELLTGSVPFQGHTPTEIAVKHLREPMPFVRDYNPEIPQSVENIILKATAKNPADRYENAGLMLYDLEHCLDPEYMNMQRLTFDDRPIANVDVSHGHVEVEYDDRPVSKPKKQRNWATILTISICAIIIAVILFLMAWVTGLVRFSGMLGYETMPDVTEMKVADAEEKLEASDFTHYKIKRKVSDSVKKGYVIETNYDAGDVVSTEDTVVLTVSKGPSYLIKDYTGLYLADVKQEFEDDDVNVKIKVKYKNASDTNPGVILKQSKLEAGDRIDPDAGETIQFTVSRYPTITIPEKIIGMDVTKAKKLLNDKGVAVVTEQVGSGSGEVLYSSPSVGSTYTQEGSDSVVTLYYD
ncbi:Stk1 family PASTA domain-containing Ser/Thr kinase [Catenisphaera adipataccumulans]|jgi:serine/threonine protein kinase|uniref:non-specific serine/threonine protein kinase n=1 Tax=Catenisphaera adipataccumulans TaxID=700500 RepID=A0A7W8FY63_9FIRM|nr:Stk1 family PASTA domain-containing Ser/Thr kinase [Catenisphaera adipataccumulans]MBB5183682.1 serine/threonine-protein kinase [Catenisphaera adipataccumulans]